MPKGVYVRSDEQIAMLRANAKKAAQASAEYWRGRERSPEQRAAHSEFMRGRSPSNKGVPMSSDQREAQTSHGHTVNADLSGTYISWMSMKQRCTNPNRGNFKYYGGRGISVCDRWLTFDHFLADMGDRPDGMQLGRIDNDGDYEPGNVEWTTRSDNIADRNRRQAEVTHQPA